MIGSDYCLILIKDDVLDYIIWDEKTFKKNHVGINGNKSLLFFFPNLELK